MTLIGPRAEVPQYVAHYTDLERSTLLVRPGLHRPRWDLVHPHPGGQVDEADDPERAYVERQLHEKLALDIDYLCDRTLARDVRVIAQTVKVLFDR